MAVVDQAKTGRYASSNMEAAATGIVADLLTPLRGDIAASAAVLLGHIADARPRGLSKTEALRSAFIVACLSPRVTMVGQ